MAIFRPHDLTSVVLGLTGWKPQLMASLCFQGLNRMCCIMALLLCC